MRLIYTNKIFNTHQHTHAYKLFSFNVMVSFISMIKTYSTLNITFSKLSSDDCPLVEHCQTPRNVFEDRLYNSFKIKRCTFITLSLVKVKLNYDELYISHAGSLWHVHVVFAPETI